MSIENPNHIFAEPSFLETEKQHVSLIQTIVEHFNSEQIKYTIAGGYGLDMLYGEITRPHDDVDMICLEHDRESIKDTLLELGFAQMKTTSMKDVYKHPNDESFKIEIGFDTALEQFGVSKEEFSSDFMPNQPNGTLLGAAFVTLNLKAQKRLEDIQNRRAEEENWGPYNREKEAKKQELLSLLEEKDNT